MALSGQEMFHILRYLYKQHNAMQPALDNFFNMITYVLLLDVPRILSSIHVSHLQSSPRVLPRGRLR
jgi:hypothetical protein